MSVIQTEFHPAEEMCSFCGIYPSCLTSFFCAECIRECSLSRASVQQQQLQMTCVSCRYPFAIDHLTDAGGYFCSPLCQERYIGSLAGDIDDVQPDLDYDSDELEKFEEEPIPSDFAPGKVYEAEGPGFYSRVKVQKDGSLKEKRGTFTPRGEKRHMRFKSWNDWRAFCWPFLK